MVTLTIEDEDLNTAGPGSEVLQRRQAVPGELCEHFHGGDGAHRLDTQGVVAAGEHG